MPSPFPLMHDVLDALWSPTIRAIAGAKEVFLTFDDGPDGGCTPGVLDVLSRRGIKATFFVVVERVYKEERIFQRILEDGHEVGNHSMDHNYREYFRSLTRTKDWIEESHAILTGLMGRRPVGFRSPAGVRTPVLHRALRELAIPMFGWNQRFYDSMLDLSPRRQAQGARRMQAGDIVLLHDLQHAKRKDGFVRNLDDFLALLQSDGFAFGSLPRQVT